MNKNGNNNFKKSYSNFLNVVATLIFNIITETLITKFFKVIKIYIKFDKI